MDFSISNTLQEMLSNLALTIPNLLKAIVVFTIGYLFIKLLSKAIIKILEKINIDKLGEKLQSIDFIETSNIEIKLSKLFGQFIYYFLLLFVIIISTDILGLQVVSNLVSDIFNFLPNLMVAIIILILGTLVADLIKKLISTTLTSIGIPSAKMISNFVFYFIIINVLVSAMTQSGIQTDFLSQNITMVIGGAVLAFSISYGLAAKQSVSNYLASFYTSDKFEIGDNISFEDIEGRIIDLDKSSCTIQSTSGKVVIPLGHLTKYCVTIKD